MSDYEKLVARVVGLIEQWDAEYRKALAYPDRTEVGYGKRVSRLAALSDAMSDAQNALDQTERERLDRWERDGLIAPKDTPRVFRLTQDYTAEDVAVDSQDGQEGYKPFDVIGRKGTLVVETDGDTLSGDEVEVTGFVADPFVVAFVQRSHLVTV
jgi:hypothetical protein